MAQYQNVALRLAEVQQLEEVRELYGYGSQREALAAIIDAFWWNGIGARPGERLYIGRPDHEYREWSEATVKEIPETKVRQALEIERIAKYCAETGRQVVILCDKPERTAMFAKLYVSYQKVDALKARFKCGSNGEIAFVDPDEAPHPQYDVPGFQSAQVHLISTFKKKLRGRWITLYQRDRELFEGMVNAEWQKREAWLERQRQDAEAKAAEVQAVKEWVKRD